MLIKRNKKEVTTENVVTSNTEVTKIEISLGSDVINLAKDIKKFFTKYSELSKDDKDVYYDLCCDNINELKQLLLKHNLVGKYISIPQFFLINDTLGIDICTSSIIDGYISIYFEECEFFCIQYDLTNFDINFEEC